MNGDAERERPTAEGAQAQKPDHALLLSTLNLLKAYIEHFGWPGSFIIFACGFVVAYATDQQKQEIIDLYVLGKSITQIWPIIVLSAVFFALTYAQYRWHKKAMNVSESEIRRIGAEKSKLQEQLAKRELQHVETNKPS